MTKGTIIYSQQEKLQAQRIGKRPDQISDSLMRLLKSTTQQALAKHPCAAIFRRHGIALSEVEEWFSSFVKGVDYVQHRYGTIFSKLHLCEAAQLDEGQWDTERCHYNPNNDCVEITAGAICNHIAYGKNQGSRCGGLQTDGERYTGAELAVLAGVEEAFHAYQIKAASHLYDGKSDPPVYGTNASWQEITHYYNHSPIERDAREIVIEAARQLGLGNNGISRILMP